MGRIRSIQELRELYNAPDLVVDVKRRMLEWLRQMIRMNQMRVAKNIF
jgi:hypothetical protein